jgi:hypothetical protein
MLNPGLLGGMEMRHRVFCVLVMLAVAAAAQSGGAPTSAEQRQAVVRLAAAYPVHPEDQALDQEAAAVVKLRMAVPDRPAAVCIEHVPWVKKKYKHDRELTLAYVLGSEAYVLQHAELKPSRLHFPALLAGSQAAIRTYQSILQLNPKAKLDKMNDWADRMQAGTFMPMLVKDCSPPNPAMSRGTGPVTAEEKQRIIALAEEIQKKPIDPALLPEYQELFIVVIQTSDFTVEITSAGNPWMDDKPEYKYGPELLALNMMAMASYVLQNPETGKSGFAHGRAGLAASLRGYEAILRQEPSAQSKTMEDALAAEKAGKLDDWYKERYNKKSTKKS